MCCMGRGGIVKISADLQALYVERDRLKVVLDKVEEDIKTLVAMGGFPNTIIVDGKEVKLKIGQLGHE